METNMYAAEDDGRCEAEGGAAVLQGFDKLLCSPLRHILWEPVKQAITPTIH